ncbi:hypothetical protein [Haloplanus salilacus]|uniref:hypothetical protein n=1 Tax=Haloplanus salilacus TaxID=2949994 RepID=UPI0030CD5F60
MDDTNITPNRRTVLRSVVAGSTVAGLAGTVSATGATGNGRGGKGFPPDGITEYGDAVSVGDGDVRPFTTETPSGNPKYHGVEFDRDALEGLPTADDLRDADNTAEADKYGSDGQALKVHFEWSLEYFVPFPDAEHTPFTFLGLNWNPEGHPGAGGAWRVPHFDIHFNMLDTGTIDAITGPQAPPYDDIPEERIPEGYSRGPVVGERYITDMGEHTAPNDAPEIPGNPDAFTNTLIQGFVGVDGDPRLAFVEPMITREYLREFDGREAFDVPQPETYPHDDRHPTAYSVRDVPADDTVAVVLEEFDDV